MLEITLLAYSMRLTFCTEHPFLFLNSTVLGNFGLKVFTSNCQIIARTCLTEHTALSVASQY